MGHVKSVDVGESREAVVTTKRPRVRRRDDDKLNAPYDSDAGTLANAPIRICREMRKQVTPTAGKNRNQEMGVSD